jgi:hypothetical protein
MDFVQDGILPSVMTAARQKTTVYLDPELLTAAKVLAASRGLKDYEVIEDALRTYMRRDDVAEHRRSLRRLLDRVAARQTEPMTDDEAMAEAYEELKEHRASRRSA